MADKSSRAQKARLQTISETGRLPQSKRTILVDLLSRTNGGRSDALCIKLCWQPHTLRSAISGLRKDGFKIETKSPAGKGGARYRITTEPGLEGA
jgi:hypothetical protein